MKDSEIMSYIKAGWSDEAITQTFLRGAHYLGNFTRKQAGHHGMAPRHTIAQTRKSEILDSIRAEGFTLTLDETRERGRERSEIYHGMGKGCTLRFIWHKEAGKRMGSNFSLRVVMPNDAVWLLANFDRRDGNAGRELTKFIRAWNEWKEQRPGFAQRLAKLRRKFDVSSSTLDAVIRKLTKTSGLTYELTQDMRGSTLRLKLRYHRCIVIRLRPDMNMTRLASIMDMIESITAALDNVGALNLTVKNYGNNVEWKVAERDGEG